MDSAIFFAVDKATINIGREEVINLQSSLDTLYQAKHDREDQNQDGDPERVPLHSIPPVIPPLRQGFRLSLVKDLLKRHQTVPPEPEPLDLPTVAPQLSTLDSPRVQLCRRGHLREPPPRLGIRRRQEQGKRLQRLGGDAVRQERLLALVLALEEGRVVEDVDLGVVV
ncbi:hypothetical protein VSDG_04901 [Cytospora chrysosperma]|uniref:Uncharacterized protein n=1 Tax=Cytospora chrysosperma TaxID=252740 RepID=A0A423W3G5_CYTCH|nr:hypothetical protein VSDG_04901 [Valsa sordida]